MYTTQCEISNPINKYEPFQGIDSMTQSYIPDFPKFLSSDLSNLTNMANTEYKQNWEYNV